MQSHVVINRNLKLNSLGILIFVDLPTYIICKSLYFAQIFYNLFIYIFHISKKNLETVFI